MERAKRDDSTGTDPPPAAPAQGELTGAGPAAPRALHGRARGRVPQASIDGLPLFADGAQAELFTTDAGESHDRTGADRLAPADGLVAGRGR